MDFNPRSLAGATGNITGNIGAGIISIHAPLRERHKFVTISSERQVFQSTLPCGSDRRFASYAITPLYFNPRSLAGATIFCMFIAIIHLFQSTLPHGSDIEITILTAAKKAFQSTLPCGSDVLILGLLFGILKFQSTLPCGSDRVPAASLRASGEFQSTLPCGSDKCSYIDWIICPVFQSTLPCGSDPRLSGHCQS